MEGVRGIVSAYERELTPGPLWRARVGSGHLGAGISAPPVPKSRPGRGNVSGQRCLYLATTEEAAVAEVRPAKHELVSVGEFSCRGALLVVDLCARKPTAESPSPFDDFAEWENWYWNERIRGEFGHRFARPVRRSDQDTDYVLTQLLADIARAEGVDGLLYESSQIPGGVSLLLFDPDLAVPTGEQHEYLVESVQYATRRTK